MINLRAQGLLSAFVGTSCQLLPDSLSKKGGFMTAVAFQTGEHWDSDNEIIKFRALVGTKQVLFGISKEALGDHFGGDEDPIKAFRSNRARIEAVAERLFARSRFEDDGLILIKTSDLG
jgi:uncharacterized protein DUF1488